jgi:hypothetical protein
VVDMTRTARPKCVLPCRPPGALVAVHVLAARGSRDRIGASSANPIVIGVGDSARASRR